MREIKFRVFDEDKNEYVDWYKDGKPTIFDIINGNDTGVFGDCFAGNTNDFILEQYTGLKDKNGVEIYEGNIVTYGWNGWTGKITYYNYAYYIEDTGDNKLTLMSDSSVVIEVIGNIHQTPELLK